MTVAIGLLAGVALSLALVHFARRKGPGSAQRIYAVGLFIAAVVYVGLAMAGRASFQWLTLETLGVVLFGAAAFAGVRRWPVVLAVGWSAHVAWDVILHLDGPGAAYTPAWYPWLCVSFDLVVAGAVLAEARRRNGPSLWPAA